MITDNYDKFTVIPYTMKAVGEAKGRRYYPVAVQNCTGAAGPLQFVIALIYAD